MKLALKIVGGFLAVIILLLIGLNLYFTNDRLQKTVTPYLNEAAGRPVETESMSLSFFSTFPNPGIEVNSLHIPGETASDTLVSLDRLVAGVELFPLFSNNVNINELVLDKPQFTYKVYADSTTNLDFFFEEEAADTVESEGFQIRIPYFQIKNGRLGYQDATSNTAARLDELNGDLSLAYADSIQSSIDITVGKLQLIADSTNYIDGLPMRLTEESVIFMDEELVRLEEGTLAIRGLELDLRGALSNWSDAFTVDLQFNSSSDNFGDLLRLLPETEYTKGLETKGSLDLGGTVQGPITENAIPDFNLRINVTDGWLKDPDLPQPIEDVQISASATNELVTIDTLSALAGNNAVTGSGTLNHPLEDTARFDMNFVANADLSTVKDFYDIAEFDIDRLAGQLDLDANARGTLDKPEQAKFKGKAILADGLLKYHEVPKPITNINVNASGSQDLLTIKSLSLQAAQNSLSAKGDIRHLLDENARRIDDMSTDIRFDLATIKEFYPIDEDTLRMEGQLRAQATLDGKADQIERAVQTGSINLKNGFIDYKEFDAPFRNITFESVLEGPRMTITEGSLETGSNSLKIAGTINNYLSEDRTVNLKTEGQALLKELANYYDLTPDIAELDGNADFDLSVSGPLNRPADLSLSGKLTVKDGNMSGEALREPVSNLNGTFSLTPAKATLNDLTFDMGSSDFDLKGSLSNYMEYLKEENKRQKTPQLSGQFSSNYLNMDELIDWSDTTSSDFKLELPDLNSSVSANINKLKITGVTMQNLNGKTTSTPKKINLSEASVELFEGKATGTMVWEIPKNRPSDFNFKGALDGLRLESFFKEFPILGKNSQFYKFISGTFSTSVDYATKIDQELNPLIQSTVMSGSFGMSEARINNHPLQDKLSSFTKINALRDLALDNWESTISIDDNVLTISDLSLTSDDIGLELNGTQHLMSERIDFHVSLLLPPRFKKPIASVITDQAADALAQESGTIAVPLAITGTYNNPSIKPDQSVIKPILKKHLEKKAGDALKSIFGRDKDKQAKPDSARADTSSNPSVNSPS